MSSLYISPEGNISGIYEDGSGLRELAAVLGAQYTVARASHVEPSGDGRWTADMGPSGGPLLGPFDTRAEALQREVEWLRAQMEGG